MKSPLPDDKPHRFQGTLRHYHRPHTPTPESWDDWGGKPPGTFSWLRWLKILVVIFGVLALIAIIVGLIIELR